MGEGRFQRSCVGKGSFVWVKADFYGVVQVKAALCGVVRISAGECRICGIVSCHGAYHDCTM